MRDASLLKNAKRILRQMTTLLQKSTISSYSLSLSLQESATIPYSMQYERPLDATNTSVPDFYAYLEDLTVGNLCSVHVRIVIYDKMLTELFRRHIKYLPALRALLAALEDYVLKTHPEKARELAVEIGKEDDTAFELIKIKSFFEKNLMK